MNQGIDFYNLSQALAGAIFGALVKKIERPNDPPPPLLQLRRGQAEAPAWFLVQAFEFDPEPISVEKLRVRDIYASERIVFSLLELMASEKWLEPVGGGEFVPTAAGRAIYGDIVKRRTEALSKVAVPLDSAELMRLESLLERIIAASMACDDPPGNWCLRHSRRNAPAGDTFALNKILYHTTDFNAFRDDAHMAAWQPYGVSAYGWEAFTFIWNGQAETAEDIDQQLYYRGYSAAEYRNALQELVKRGWLVETAGKAGYYGITAEGKAIRETAERQTDAYFYAPWRVLEAADVLELHQLILKLKDGI